MSATTEAAADEIILCASCGKSECDDGIKLKKCTACHLVRYCSVKCQKDHRPQHKKECKKRAVELREEILFKQPESTDLGDCPICMLPIPPFGLEGNSKYTTYTCCSTFVCNGCVHANNLRLAESGLPQSCPFCRHPFPVADETLLLMKRAEANDPFALYGVGTVQFERGDYATAIEYFEKAAGLGDIASHYQLSCIYREGLGVEKDVKKFMLYAEEAAIGGHPVARFNLGSWEMMEGSIAKSVKHLIIAANLGLDEAIDALRKCYGNELVSKEDFSAALRGYQVAVNEMKSPQRDAAEMARELGTWLG